MMIKIYAKNSGVKNKMIFISCIKKVLGVFKRFFGTNENDR